MTSAGTHAPRWGPSRVLEAAGVCGDMRGLGGAAISRSAGGKAGDSGPGRSRHLPAVSRVR